MKKIIIVGAGIAGLTAGVYARQSGFDVTIYESHSIPGGASTSWRRKGYLFEGGMHWLTGSSPHIALNRLWRETGALDDNTSIYNRDPFFVFEKDGKQICLYRDVDRLEKHLLQLSPEDDREIRTLCRDIKKFTHVSMPISNLKGVQLKNKTKENPWKMLSMLPALPRMGFYAGLSAKEYAMRFQSPLLQELFQGVVGEENSATALIFTLATLASGDGGYPEGGSLGMAARIADKFLALGGRIQYNAMVNQVIVENGIATGILVDGKKLPADAVIVTQDTLTAIDSLFHQPIREPWAEKMRQNTVPMLNTFFCFGVKADLCRLPESSFFTLEEPICCGGRKINALGVNNYAAYPGYAPKGCTALTGSIMGDSYEWWKARREDGSYGAEKQKLAEAFMKALTRKYPQLEGAFEVWDIATPLTYERYLHSYKGSWMSILKKNTRMTLYPCKPESIRNLYFAGQRLMPPGGLPCAVETGRKAVQHLCLDTDTVFQGNV